MRRYCLLVVLCVVLAQGLAADEKQHLNELKSGSGPKSSSTPLRDRIRHIVVLMEENRSFDHMLGFYRGPNGEPKVNGLNGSEWNPLNRSYHFGGEGSSSASASSSSSSSLPVEGKVYVSRAAPYINSCDPNHGTPATAFKIYGPDWEEVNRKNDSEALMNGFVQFEYSSHPEKENPNKLHYCGVMDMFDTRVKLPVMTALADEFLVMDRMFCSVPGPTWPNRQFFMSASSGGMTETEVWFQGVQGKLFPQPTIFDQLMDVGTSWGVFYEDTPWELFFETLAHHPEHIHTMDVFYAMAAEGALPLFSFINPRGGINVTTGLGSDDQHPDHDVALGELYYKTIYEALRAGPKWNETLFVITYDEHGGFYDHVPPPVVNIPPPGTPVSGPNSSYPDKWFGFDRLGVRIPTLLISPWIKKGQVLSAPPESQKPFESSEYDLTSIIASSRKILRELEPVGPLTARDAWVATWEHVLLELDEPRTDCPDKLPDAPPPTLSIEEGEADLPMNALQQEILQFHAALLHDPPQRKPSGESLKQRHFGEAAQAMYHQHREGTLDWKRYKKQRMEPAATSLTAATPRIWDVLVTPFGERNNSRYSFHFGTRNDEPTRDHWRNITIWMDVEDESSSTTTFCLDYYRETNGSTSLIGPENDFSRGNQLSIKRLLPSPAMNGDRVGVSPCYPSHDPSRNRDPTQKWMWTADATIRPLQNASLCVTGTFYTEGGLSNSDASSTSELVSRTLSLKECLEGDPRQHFEYDGKAPGTEFTGRLVFGAYSCNLALYPPNF
jgi:phospholipase C